MSYQILGKSGQMSASRPGCLLGFALFWISFSSIFVFIGLTTEAGIIFTLVGLLFVAAGLAMLLYALMAYFTRYKVGKPNFVLSQTTLRVGDQLAFSVSHTFPRSVAIDRICTNLIFREKATYQQGTDTKTVTHDHIITSVEEPGRQFQAGQIFSQSYNFLIPPDSMHTLKVRRNELTWHLKFEAEISKLPNFIEEFELNVVPEITLSQVTHG